MIELENEYNREWTYKRHTAQSLWICSQSLNANKDFKSLEEIFEEINKPTKVDDKTAEDIVQDVLRKFKEGA